MNHMLLDMRYCHKQNYVDIVDFDEDSNKQLKSVYDKSRYSESYSNTANW